MLHRGRQLRESQIQRMPPQGTQAGLQLAQGQVATRFFDGHCSGGRHTAIHGEDPLPVERPDVLGQHLEFVAQDDAPQRRRQPDQRDLVRQGLQAVGRHQGYAVQDLFGIQFDRLIEIEHPQQGPG